MIEITGDFTKEYKKYRGIVCTTNQILNKDGKLVMGAGIAKWFKETFPWTPEAFALKKEQVTVFPIDLLSDEYPNVLFSFPTKFHWKDKSDIVLIEKSTKELVKLVNNFSDNDVSILMTRPGCGCGGLDWKDVKPIIEQYLDNRFTVISNEDF